MMITLSKNGKLKFNSIQKVKLINDWGYLHVGAKQLTKNIQRLASKYEPYASWSSDDWKESRILQEKSDELIEKLKEEGVLFLEFIQVSCSAYPNGYTKDLLMSKESKRQLIGL